MSFKPRPIVLRAMPVTRETAAIPPCPAALASEDANSRRCRSSRWGRSIDCRSRRESSSIITNDTTSGPKQESLVTNAKRLRFTYSLTRPKREVVIYDYVDHDVPVLARMAAKRAAGYAAIGYTIADSNGLFDQPLDLPG